MISETRILRSLRFGFIIINFDEAAYMQCCQIVLLYIFLVRIFSWCDLFQVKETDASCIHYIICSHFTTFQQVTLYSAYCAWFVAFLASTDAVLLRTSTYLFFAQFGSSVYIRIQFWVALTCAKSLLLRLKVIAPT